MIKMISVAIIVALVSFAASWVLFAQPQQIATMAVTPEEAERQAYARKFSDMFLKDLAEKPTQRYGNPLPKEAKDSNAVHMRFMSNVLHCAFTQTVRRMDAASFSEFKLLVDDLVINPKTIDNETFSNRLDAVTKPSEASFEATFGEGPMEHCNNLELAKYPSEFQ